jgi:hypothetical protein
LRPWRPASGGAIIGAGEESQRAVIVGKIPHLNLGLDRMQHLDPVPAQQPGGEQMLELQTV